MVAFEGALLGVGGLLILGPRAGAPAEHHGVMLARRLRRSSSASPTSPSRPSPASSGTRHPRPRQPVAARRGSRLGRRLLRLGPGLQDGEAVEVIAITGTAANISCIAGGIIVFGDPLPGTALGIAVQAVAFVLVVAASALTPAPVRSAERAASPPRPALAACGQQDRRDGLGVVVTGHVAAAAQRDVLGPGSIRFARAAWRGMSSASRVPHAIVTATPRSWSPAPKR